MSGVDLEQLVAYEVGPLSDEDTVELFQNLIDSGLVWRLGSRYSRTAQYFLDSGQCHLPSSWQSETT